MKLPLPIAALGLAAACGSALATEYGTVVSATPVTAQVAVPLQQCSEQQVQVQPRTSGGGALLGALVGGVVGHNIGDGLGRAAATGLGAVAGSVIGDRAEAANTPAATVPVRNCQTLTSYENRVIGYDVTYDYNGQRYSTRVAQDPGPRIALNVSVTPAAGPVAAVPVQPAPVTTVAPPPVVVAPAYGYYGPYYGPYGYYGYYDYGGPVVTVAPRVVIGGGYRHHRY
ncbi:MAG TPA: glycine zipper 2TM domain-containing protein [Burkholderiaceae bacterium]|nr:glycine zipper 2TM domain-containing protein [Burkholderiaceae bacterium]